MGVIFFPTEISEKTTFGNIEIGLKIQSSRKSLNLRIWNQRLKTTSNTLKSDLNFRYV